MALTVATTDFWHGRKVLITGHTGFKGAWLAYWLVRRGARVTGFALAPDTAPSLFDQLALAGDLDHRVANVRDAAAVRSTMREVAPDIVLHLAAQALVLRGYREPLATWSTNVMGTAHVLDAMRTLDQRCAGVMVTTDKVYHNQEWAFGYRETDRLGGYDPYSASKAACELAVDSWRKSFLTGSTGIRVASARAGNVVGGGDWSERRIVPDIVRALASDEVIEVRRPDAVRPWQHVLEPLGGYLLLAQRLYEADDDRAQTAFNFGPAAEAERSVRDVVEEALRHWPGAWRDTSDAAAPHEAGRLALCIDRARAELGWAPRWDFAQTIARTVDWYRASIGADTDAVRRLVDDDIAAYTDTAGARVTA